MRWILCLLLALSPARAFAEAPVLPPYLALGAVIDGTAEQLVDTVTSQSVPWTLWMQQGPEDLGADPDDRDALIIQMRYRTSASDRLGMMSCVRFGPATQAAILDRPDGPLAQTMLGLVAMGTEGFGTYDMILECHFGYQADRPLPPHRIWAELSSLPGQAAVAQDPTTMGRTMLAEAPWIMQFVGDAPAGIDAVLYSALYHGEDRMQSLNLRFVQRAPMLGRLIPGVTGPTAPDAAAG